MRFVAAILTLPLLCAGADDLLNLRDRQDRPALESRAAALQAAAEKRPGDADGWYKGALAWSYAAEVAMEMGDKGGSKRSAEAGIALADKAIAINGNNAEYYRILGTLCGQVIPANPLAGILVYGKKAKEALDKAVAMDPKSAQAFLAHGVGYYYLPDNFGGGPDNAIKDFQRAIALDPDRVWTKQQLAKTPEK